MARAGRCRDSLGLTLSSAERPVFAAIVALARPQLDEAAWAAAWAEGRAMSLEQAIAYAADRDE